MVKCPDLSVRPCVAEPCGLRCTRGRTKHEDYVLSHWLNDHAGKPPDKAPTVLSILDPDGTAVRVMVKTVAVSQHIKRYRHNFR